MKKKINAYFIIVATVMVLATLIITTVVYYGIYSDTIIDGLKLEAQVIESLDESQAQIDQQLQIAGLRITYIGRDGVVLYDNQADETKMENHKNREEVVEALKTGEGSSVRVSATLDKNTYYYAKLVDGKYILRIARAGGSIWKFLDSAFPVLLLALFVAAGAIALLSTLLTKSLIAPIENMANHLDDLENIKTYKELSPFIETITMQHNDIMRNADMRQEFTANVSHELKTPLTAIRGYSELIERNMTDEEQTKKFAKQIRKSAERQLSLINDILRLGELDASSIDEDFEQIDLYNVAEDAVNTVENIATENHITVCLEGKGAKIYGNRSMIGELVDNLTQNAVRYTNEGGRVTIGVHCDQGRVELVVRDNGIGISKEDQVHIFERFYRVDRSRSKNTGGTGLGLAIVKHVAQKHGAEIEVISELGTGTTIKVIFKEDE